MDEQEFGRFRERFHKLADQVHEHEIQLREHGVLIGVLNQYVDSLRSTMASREQLDTSIAAVTLKLVHLHDDLAPIKKGINWIVGLILGAVVIALISLVIKGGVQ